MRIQQARTIGRWFISSDSSSPFMERSRLRYLFTIDSEESIKETMSQEYCCFWSSFSSSNPSPLSFLAIHSNRRQEYFECKIIEWDLFLLIQLILRHI